jgi:hypothetical protein
MISQLRNENRRYNNNYSIIVRAKGKENVQVGRNMEKKKKNNNHDEPMHTPRGDLCAKTFNLNLSMPHL